MKFILMMPGQTRKTRHIREFFKKGKYPRDSKWVKHKRFATPISLKEAKIYLKDWEKYGVEAILIYE